VEWSLTSGFTFLGINVFYINIAKGIIIVAAVVADHSRQISRVRWAGLR